MSTFNLKLSQESRKRVRRGVILTIVIAILLVALQIKPIAQAAYTLQAAVQLIGNRVGGFYQDTFTTKDDLRRERDELQQLVGNLAIDQAYLDQLERDVFELQTLINYRQELTYEATPAKILARSSSNEHEILIDQGSQQGIREQMAVIVEEGHMIGYTSQINNHTSSVTLLKNINSRIPVAILGETRTLGLVSGQEGFLLKMDFIPQSENLNVGDVVVTSGLDGNFPSGLIVGVVSEVIQVETSNFQEALIEPIFAPEDFSNVLILDPFNETYAQ